MSSTVFFSCWPNLRFVSCAGRLPVMKRFRPGKLMRFTFCPLPIRPSTPSPPLPPPHTRAQTFTSPSTAVARRRVFARTNGHSQTHAFAFFKKGVPGDARGDGTGDRGLGARGLYTFGLWNSIKTLNGWQKAVPRALVIFNVRIYVCIYTHVYIYAAERAGEMQKTTPREKPIPAYTHTRARDSPSGRVGRYARGEQGVTRTNNHSSLIPVPRYGPGKTCRRRKWKTNSSFLQPLETGCYSGPRSVCVIRGVAMWTAIFGTTRSDASV